MQSFELSELLEKARTTNRSYHEFVRVPALSAGLYELPAGGTDPQQPHAEDELYYVLRGRAVLQVGTEDRPILVGSLVYVPAHAPHRFHSITEDLTLLVLFAPAESEVST